MHVHVPRRASARPGVPRAEAGRAAPPRPAPTILVKETLNVPPFTLSPRLIATLVWTQPHPRPGAPVPFLRENPPQK